MPAFATPENRFRSERLSHLQKLNAVLNEIWERNLFYTQTWCNTGVKLHRLSSLEQLAEFPLITRAQLLADQTAAPPLGTNLTYPLASFKRFHHSSGTTSGSPIFWADTVESWSWVIKCSQELFSIAGISSSDRIFFALPFAAGSGPWIIYEGACRLDRSCLTAGQSTMEEQAGWLKKFRPTILVGKPSHLLELGEFIEASGSAPARLAVEKLILTGENSFSPIREPLEKLWSAQCFDRYGLTEAGSVASECPAHFGGLHLLGNEFIAEAIDPETAQPVSDGELGELVLTNLGRPGRPIIRYRTGDRTRLLRNFHCACGRYGTILLGGVTRPEI